MNQSELNILFVISGFRYIGIQRCMGDGRKEIATFVFIRYTEVLMGNHCVDVLYIDVR